jgi:hypothetical protein
MISDDEGVTWRERDLAAASDASDHPRVLAFNNQFYVLWNSGSEPLRVVTLR